MVLFDFEIAFSEWKEEQSIAMPLWFTEKGGERDCCSYTCRRMPLVAASPTPLITMDKTRACRDMRCSYSKIKLTKLPLNNLLDKFLPPFIL